MYENKVKLYAKTLNPECYDYRIYSIEDDDYNEVIIDGGKEFPDIDNKGYLKAIKKVINEYNDWNYDYYYGGSIMSYLKDMLPKKENGKKLHPLEAHKIKEALDKGDDRYANRHTMCVCLEVITGKKHVWKALRGYCQGDYVEAYYPEETSKEYVDFVEAWYFGTGTEVMVHEEENDVEDASDIEGWTFYTAQFNIEDIKRKVRRECGYDDNDENVEVVLWTYDRTTYVATDHYKKA